MNVLLVASGIDRNPSGYASWIVENIRSCDYICEVVSPKQINSYDYHFDIVIALNKAALSCAKKLTTQKGVPLIYLFTTEGVNNYPQDLSIADHFILMETTSLMHTARIPSCVSHLRFCPYLHNVNEIAANPHPHILVALDTILPKSHTLLKLLTVFNTLTSTQFILVGAPKVLTPICNQNIRSVPELSDELFRQASLIIASGQYVYKAISSQKPCIVAGDRGYCGIINSENFEIQYQTQFQGRIGGELDEYIPPEFIQSDIAFLQQSIYDEETKRRCLIVTSKLKQKRLEILEHFKTILEKTVWSYRVLKENPECLRLKWSAAYSFLHLQDRFAITQAFSKKLYSIVEKDEMEIIYAFNEPVCVQDAYSLFKEKFHKADFIAFVSELIQEKILVIDN